VARGALPAAITLRGSGRSTQVPVELAGPGDVAGLDPREVGRTEPHDGAADFEPSYFPYVELVSPDLPWRFTPSGPVTERVAGVERERLQPWLALVVVPEDAATLTPAARGALPVLGCDGAELPDPAEAWAWAHVQGGDVAVARLLCPRRLAGRTRYLACLVPTFDAGRIGLGGGGGDPLGPAWSRTGEASLPVYFSFAFATGDEGSFETLARRLRARPAPAGAGGRDIATDSPGWGVVGTPGATTSMQGALRPLAGDADELPPDNGLAAQLAAAVSASGTGVELRPPIYGQDHAGGATAVDANAPSWLDGLNTDPRRRLAAGMAAWAVAVEQEDLADRAWAQLAAAGLRPVEAADPQLAAEVGGALAARGAPAATAPALARLARPGGPLSPLGRAPVAPAISPAPQAAAEPRYSPTFDEPASDHLRALSPEWLLPGTGDLPDDSVVVLRTNPAFAEAFLVGLNHALARELVWRGFPLDTTGTPFRRFWEGSGAEPPPLAEWDAASALGSHDPGGEQLVLLLRGALVRRFPTAVVLLTRTDGAGAEAVVRPTLAVTLEPGTRCLGFPLTPDDALHAPADGGTGWSVVIQEAVDHPRFGVDDPPVEGSAPLHGWQDLDWGHPHLRGATHVPVAGELEGVALQLTAQPSPVPVPSPTWGVNAAHQAAIISQPAFRIRVPVELWVTA
jgi:hypothetical protein